jgi:hypothetical protein
MGVVALRDPGLIYEDTFDSLTLNSGWEVIGPTTRWSLSDAPGFLRLKHGSDPVYFFFTELSGLDQFVFSVKNDYNPLEAGDVGGVMIYSNDQDYMSLEEYFDSTKGTAMTYPWIRIVRDYNAYSAYYSDDGAAWTLIGTNNIGNGVPKIGLFVTGSSGQTMDVDTVRVLKSNKVTVGNLSPGTMVELIDSTGVVLATRSCITRYTSVDFDVSQYASPLNGRFRVTLPDASVFEISDELIPIYGGDYYTFGVNVDLYFVNADATEETLIQGYEKFLGYINDSVNDYDDFKLVARNHMSGTFSNIIVTVAQSHGTDHYLRLVEIAPDASGVAGTFTSAVTINTLAPGGGQLFWLRVHREDQYVNIREYAYFGLNIASTYTT